MNTVRSYEKANKFHLISSNRLENLTVDLGEKLNSAVGKSPLDPELVIVQSRGMERYLRLKLARLQGVSANMEFPFPQKFVEDYIFKSVLSDKKENQLELGVLTWDIFKVLPSLSEQDEDFNVLKQYLEDDPGGLKTFQLSGRIADLFEKYTVFRPDLLRKWSFDDNPLKNNPHSRWQVKLWREVAPYRKGFHFSDLYLHTLKSVYPEVYGESKFKTPEFDELKNVRRIFLFGFSSLAPVFLDLFFAVSKYIDVYFYYLNPCEVEWQYDLSERARLHLQSRTSLVEKADFQFGTEIAAGNSLLSSMGGQGREFFALLASSEEEAETLFDYPADDGTLLHKIQRDIQVGENSRHEEISSDDRSVQLHSCHSPMREVEVLFENLTAMFQVDPTLLPKDIIVLAPDINTYAPYIEAVFKSLPENDPRWCFITLADRSQAAAVTEAGTFLDILKITRSRFKVSEVMGIWESPAVAAAFGLDESMAAIVRQWIIDARIFWGIDGDFREETVGINFPEQSWRQGIERILAGFAFGGEAQDAGITLDIGGEDILPLYCCEGDSALLFGKLVDFLESLFALRTELNSDADIEPEAFSVSWWESVLSGIINKFFPSLNEFAPRVTMLRDAVAAVLEKVRDSEYDGEISFEIIYDELSNYFTVSRTGGGFLRGGITFCEARPLRSIPARVICLLGMDEHSFPRREKHLSFDLMAAKPRLGDRSARKDDRYLFIETLLSARDCFYASYVGQGIKDNEERLPSVLLCELLDYINDNYRFSEETKDLKTTLVTKHPLQPFSWKYFIADEAKEAYAERLGIKIPENLISYSAESRELVRLKFATPLARIFAGTELAEIPRDLYRVELEDLCRFFTDPAKYFLQNCLQVYPQVRDLPELADCESFELDGLDQYQIAEMILKKYLPSWYDIDEDRLKSILKKRFYAEGLLPLKAWGDIQFEKFYENFLPFARKLSTIVNRPEPSVSGESEFDSGVSLHAELDDFYRVNGEIRQIQFRYSKSIKSKAKLQIRAALSELSARALEVVPDAGSLKLIGRDSKPLSFDSGSAEAAREKLERLTEIYLEGLRKPLAFFPETSLAYIRGGRSAASGKWEGNDFSRGEKENAAFICCFGKNLNISSEFEKVSEEIVTLLDLK
jgi:exodeoxyribonuclease V gamma subunit